MYVLEPEVTVAVPVMHVVKVVVPVKVIVTDVGETGTVYVVGLQIGHGAVTMVVYVAVTVPPGTVGAVPLDTGTDGVVSGAVPVLVGAVGADGEVTGNVGHVVVV